MLGRSILFFCVLVSRRDDMKKCIYVFILFLLLIGNVVQVSGYDTQPRALTNGKIIKVPFKVTRKSDGKYFMWSDMTVLNLDGHIGFCVDPLTKVSMSAKYSNVAFTQVLTESQRNQISKILNCGYFFRNHQSDNYYLATQKLVWESLGYSVKYYAKNSDFTGSYDVSVQEKEIVRLMNSYDKKVSFDQSKFKLCIGETLVLVDENQVLNDFIVECDSDAVEITQVGNELHILAKDEVKGLKVLLYKGDKRVDEALFYAHKASGSQTFVTMEKGAVDPVVASFEIDVLGFGDVELLKVDAESKQSLAGVVFEVSSDESFSENVQQVITDVSGKIQLLNLVEGTYYYREVSTIEPYVKDEEVRSFTIQHQGLTSVVCENRKQKVQLKIRKQASSLADFEASSASLDGAEYYVLAQDKTTVLERVKAIDNVAVVNTLLDVNTQYYVQEIVAPKGMEINPQLIEVYVPYDKEQGNLSKEVICYDEVIKNKIELTKYVHQYQDEQVEKIIGEGFEFAIYNEENVLVDTITTNTEGKGSSHLLPYGTYTIVENKKDGYRSIEPMTVNIDSSYSKYQYEFINEPIDYQLEILKVDTKNQPIANVSYAISTDKNMEEVLMCKSTDENGKLVFTHLLEGTYYVQEQSTLDRYVLDTQIYEIVMDKDCTYTFVNVDKEVEVQIFKCDEKKRPIANVGFRVLDSRNEVKEGITNADGKLSFYLPYGDYSIEETIVPEGYMGLEEPLQLTIDKDRVYTLEVVNHKIEVVNTASSAMPPVIAIVVSIIGFVVCVAFRMYS